MSEISGYLEPSEVRAIINAVPNVSQHPERDVLMLETMWQTGGRVTEIITMVPERIGTSSIVMRNLKQYKRIRDDDGKMQRIRDQDRTKEIPVQADLCKSLKLFCDAKGIDVGDFVFQGNQDTSQHLDRRYVWWMVTRAAESVRVYKFGKKNSRTGGRFKGAYPHLFRHGAGSHLYEATNDIMLVRDILGHSDVKTTQVYTHIKQRDIKRKISDVDWSGKE